MKKVIVFCFYIPLFLNVLNTQAFIAKFVSVSFSQVFAYGSIGLILLGVILIIRRMGIFSPLIKFWFAFYIIYYALALTANVVLDTEPPILRTLVAVTYFFGFAVLLSIPEELPPVSKVLALGFFATCILLIIFQRINFSMDHDGIYEYKLDRAGGVYGDANNAAVATILSFLFIKFSFTGRTKLENWLKGLAMIVSLYAFLLTFSKTGFVVLILALGLTYHRYFTVKRIVFAIVLIPTFLSLSIYWALNSNVLTIVQKDRIESLLNLATFQTQKVSFSDRDVLLKNMLSYINQNPYLGNGVDFGVGIRGHNTVIGVWADAGILGFLVFLFLLVAFIKRSLLSPPEIKFFALSVLVTLYIYMLSLQTIINQGNLMVVFAFLGYLLYQKNTQSIK